MRHRNRTLFRHGMTLAIGLGLLCASSVAQDASTPVAATSVAPVEAPSLDKKVQDYKVSIEFAGKRTRITEFVKVLQDQLPTRLNIVITRDGDSIMIPQMRLDNVSVQAALNAVSEATENEMNWHFGDENEVIFIEKDIGYASETSELVEVVNASRILEATEEASLLSAIQIGLELRGSSQDNVTIKLHKETKLLFVKGIYADINVVKRILSELGGTPWPQGGQGGGGFGGGQGGGGGGGGLGGSGSGGGVF